MRKRSLIQAVDQTTDDTATETEGSVGVTQPIPNETEEVFEEEWYAEPEPVRSFGWVVPALAILAILGWTGFFGWAHQAEIIAAPAPSAWTGLVTQWAVPVLLIVSLWLLAMRNSTREARRFSDVAQTLSAQSAELETRLVTVNRELSLAREFLATQTKELDYLGRTATERLSEHAERLQALVGENGEQVDAIARVSVTALENMDKLRDNLPVIANSAKDVSNQIGGAGREAQSQLDELVQGFERLNEFGSASERQVGSLRKRIDEALDAFSAQADQLGTITTQRFAELRDNSESFRGELDSREVAALASIRARFETLRDEMAEADAVTASERDAAMDSLRDRLDTMRRETAEATTAS